MNFFTISIGILFTILSTAILSYISLATMLGPWIAPFLILLSNLLVSLRFKKKSPLTIKQEIISIQAIAAGGGIIAVGIGFAVPVLYFLDKQAFICWLQDPYRFCWLIMAVCISAGSLGIFLGRRFIATLVDQNDLPFPVSKLTYKVMIVKEQLQQTLSMFAGIVSSLVVNGLRDGLYSFKGILPHSIYIFPRLFGQKLEFTLWPFIWAIGYTVGPVVAFPLFVGLLSKYAVLYPLNHHSTFLPFSLFKPMINESFVTAFCSGLVISELIVGVLQNPSPCIKFIKKIVGHTCLIIKQPLKYISSWILTLFSDFPKKSEHHNILHKLEPIFAFATTFALLRYLKFSIPAQIVLITFTIIATYEISFIGAKIGLLQLGRFSAFVLIPMMLIFKLNFIQITAICVFFNVCAATCSDFLFDCKTGSFCDLKRTSIHLAQWIGLLVTSLSIGIIMYLLFTHLTLGSDQLVAARGRSRALLVQTLNLDMYVVGLGFLYGVILKKMKISPTMTFGGIIMPNHLTIGLIFGGLISLLPRDKEKYIPFCSGVFASGALWILISILLKIL
ncbi:MAG: hypothetical protein V1855_05310 [bacterium]